jgi:hypothetical protein
LFLGKPIVPHPGETAEELQKRTKDAIEGIVKIWLF